MRALSLDASTTHIGWAVFDDDDLVAWGRLEPNKPKLDWRGRCENLAPQLDKLISDYKPEIIYQEEVPKGGSGGVITGIQLGFLQGILYMVECVINNLPVKYIEVGTWRKNLGINDGNQHRDAKKIKSIQKANELFGCYGVNLPLVFTKSGNYSEALSNDDSADALNLYASTRDKYRKPLAFGKRRG
jgi:hypothetical protein